MRTFGAKVFWAALILVWAAAGQTGGPRGDAPALFSAGRQALAQGNLTGAEADFLQVVHLDPRQAGAWVNLGVIAMRRQQWPLAVDRLKKAEALDPAQPGIRLNLGLVYFRQRRYGEAIAPFRSVVGDQPDSLQARYLLGLCYFLTRQDAPAVSVLEPLWSREQNDLTYLYVVGIAADHAHRPELQKQAELRLLQVGKGSPELNLILGRTFLNRDEAQRAIPLLEQAAAADPKLPMVHFNLGLAYEKTHQLEQARKQYLADLALEPDVAYNYDHLGAVAALEHQNAAAVEWYRKAIRQDPRLATARYGLASVLLRQRQFAEALRQLDAAQRLSPKSGSVHYLKGRVLMGMGKKPLAQREFAEASRLQKASQDELELEISGKAPARSLPGPVE